MIIKGSSRSSAAELARHLLRTDTNEKVHILGYRGTIARDVRGALLEMEDVAAGTNVTKFLYHASMSINSLAGEKLTRDQWLTAIETLEARLGFSADHQRVIVMHVKKDRTHVHVVWNRVNGRTMKAPRMSHNYRRHEETARELERKFGHARVQGAHAEREGVPRPARTPSNKEMQQQERTEVRLKSVEDAVLAAWENSANGQEFINRLRDAGFVMARGDQRVYVLVDRTGNVHSLRRRLRGVTAAEVRAKMADVPLDSLPTVEQARERMFRVKHPVKSGSSKGARGSVADAISSGETCSLPRQRPGLSRQRVTRPCHGQAPKGRAVILSRPNEQRPDSHPVRLMPKSLAMQRRRLRKMDIERAKELASVRKLETPASAGSLPMSLYERWVHWYKPNGWGWERFKADHGLA